MDVVSVFDSARAEVAEFTMKITIAVVVVEEAVIVHLNHPSLHGMMLAITFAETVPV